MMRTRLVKLPLYWLAAAVLAAPLCLGSGGMPPNDPPVSVPIQTPKATDDRQTEDLKRQVSDARNESAKLTAQVNHLKGEVGKWRKVALIEGGLIGGVILLLGGGIFVLTFRGKASPRPATTEPGANCPNCGWKLASGDSICRNPDCRTRFH